MFCPSCRRFSDACFLHGVSGVELMLSVVVGGGGELVRIIIALNMFFISSRDDSTLSRRLWADSADNPDGADEREVFDFTDLVDVRDACEVVPGCRES